MKEFLKGVAMTIATILIWGLLLSGVFKYVFQALSN